MLNSPSLPSAVAPLPVTLKSARSARAVSQVTATDRSPEIRDGGAVYTRQRLLELRSWATGGLSDSLQGPIS